MPPVSDQLEKEYGQLLEKLLELDPLEEEVSPKERRLILDRTALDEWQAFRKDVESAMAAGGSLTVCSGWGAKISGFILRVAAVLHVAEKGVDSFIIDLPTMKRATEMGYLLRQHAIATFCFMGAGQVAQDARTICEWILEKKTDSFSLTELTRGLRGKVPVGDRRNKAIQELIGRNILGQQETISTRKPTTRYSVNPKLLI